MANHDSLKLTFFQKVNTLLLFIFRPCAFKSKSLNYDKKINSLSNSPAPDRIQEVKKTYRTSFIFTSLAGIIGFTISIFFNQLNIIPSSRVISILQAMSALFFLWATLAKGGWNILSWAGNTLPEQVDRWIFRILYFIGTGLIIFTIFLK